MRERVKELCRAKGVSLTKAETDMGFAKGYLSKLDQSTPSGPKLKTMSEYFGVSVEYLLTGEEKKIAKRTMSPDFMSLIDSVLISDDETLQLAIDLLTRLKAYKDTLKGGSDD